MGEVHPTISNNVLNCSRLGGASIGNLGHKVVCTVCDRRNHKLRNHCLSLLEKKNENYCANTLINYFGIVQVVLQVLSNYLAIFARFTRNAIETDKAKIISWKKILAK